MDQWLPVSPIRTVRDNGGERDPEILVCELIDQQSREWRLDVLQAICDLEDIPLIRRIKPTRFDRADGFCWLHTKSGLYSVKSGYDLSMSLKEITMEVEVTEPSLSGLKNKVWSLKTSRKIKHFLWQSISNCLAVCSNLVNRHCGTDRSCPQCGNEEETINHLLFTCPPALQTWALSEIPSAPGIFPTDSVYENFDFLLLRVKKMGVPEKNIACFDGFCCISGKQEMRKCLKERRLTPETPSISLCRKLKAG